MLTSYLIGNLLGRLILSYFLVWLVCLAVSRGNWRLAFNYSRRWYIVIAILLVFILGLAGSLTHLAAK